jgi:hypothetical protein
MSKSSLTLFPISTAGRSQPASQSFPLIRSKIECIKETLGDFPMAKKAPPSTQHRQKSQAIRQGLDVVSGFLTEDVLLAIQDAAANADTCSMARADIHKFLASKGVTIPETLFISVLHAAPPQTRVAPPGLEHLVPAMPPICPPGMVPTLVTETVKVCRDRVWITITKHDFATGEDYEIFRMLVCVAWENREEERWYCRLPALKPAQPTLDSPPVP